jgi:hypothetical protein
MGERTCLDCEAAGIIENELRAAIATLEAEVERLRGALSFDEAQTWAAVQQRELEQARARIAVLERVARESFLHILLISCIADPNEIADAAREGMAALDANEAAEQTEDAK